MLIEGTHFSLLAEGELEEGIDSHSGEACLIAADSEEISPSLEGEPPHSSLHLSLVLSTMALLRAGLNPPSAEPAENGQQMQEAMGFARHRRRGRRSHRWSIHMPPAGQGNKCLSQGTRPDATLTCTLLPQGPCTKPVELPLWSSVLLHLEMTAQVGFGIGSGDFSATPPPCE